MVFDAGRSESVVSMVGKLSQKRKGWNLIAGCSITGCQMDGVRKLKGADAVE